MLLKNLYTLDDFQRLTQDEISNIKKSLELEIPNEKDECEYIYEHMDILDSDPIVQRIVSSKILAGQVAVKWYKFKYDDIFTKNVLEEKLSLVQNGYGLIASQRTDLHEDIVSIVTDDEGIYTIKTSIPTGKRRVYEENGFGYKRIETKRNIIAKIDTENLWLEIRGDYKKSDKVKRILERKLGLNNTEEVSILNRYNGDINCFKESLNNGFYLNYKAIPNMELDLTEEDCKSIANIMESINLYFMDKDDEQLIENLKQINFDTEDLSIFSIFLAGIDHLGLQVKKNSEKDLSSQSLYSMFKDYLVEDTGYISFSIEENEDSYTMQVGKKTNSIVFRSSVTEKVIKYIRDLIL